MPENVPQSPASTEYNVESRTVLAFRVDDQKLQTSLPPGWAAMAAGQGPSHGANLNVIFAERLLVQGGDEEPMAGQATNQIVVVAVPVKPAGGYPGGVFIALGLSAQAAGAPGPYGVFAVGTAEVERLLRAPSDDTHRSTECWTFRGDAGLTFDLRLGYTRRTPARSHTETVAYSAKDPNFHRTYYADQGADVLRSVPGGVDRVSDFEFHAVGGDGSPLAQSLEGLSAPVSVVSLPWTVRRAVIAPPAALLGLQSLHPADFALGYSAREQTMWADSPYQPRENGMIERGDPVWLDKEVLPGGRGVCRVKLADGRLRYVAEAGRLRRQDQL
jgi:hypothetical protein